MAKRTTERAKSDYIENPGKYQTRISEVEVVPKVGTPTTVKVTFQDVETDATIRNFYSFEKKDGSLNFGAQKAFERLLEIRYGDVEFFEWDEDELIGTPVEIEVVLTESADGKTYRNVGKVAPGTAVEDDDEDDDI